MGGRGDVGILHALFTAHSYTDKPYWSHILGRAESPPHVPSSLFLSPAVVWPPAARLAIWKHLPIWQILTPTRGNASRTRWRVFSSTMCLANTHHEYKKARKLSTLTPPALGALTRGARISFGVGQAGRHFPY